MTDALKAAERGLDDHASFERADGAFAVTTTPFDARVRVSPTDEAAVDAEDAVAYTVTVRAPTLNAAVRDVEVAGVVREGWFETFERRLEDVAGVTRVDPTPPRARLDPDAGEVVVETGFVTADAALGADDAAALVGFVEGTYLEGVIPGYDYGDPVAALLRRARERSEPE